MKRGWLVGSGIRGEGGDLLAAGDVSCTSSDGLGPACGAVSKGSVWSSRRHVVCLAACLSGERMGE